MDLTRYLWIYTQSNGGDERVFLSVSILRFLGHCSVALKAVYNVLFNMREIQETQLPWNQKRFIASVKLGSAD